MGGLNACQARRSAFLWCIFGRQLPKVKGAKFFGRRIVDLLFHDLIAFIVIDWVGIWAVGFHDSCRGETDASYLKSAAGARVFQHFPRKSEEDSTSPSASWHNRLSTRALAMKTAFNDMPELFSDGVGLSTFEGHSAKCTPRVRLEVRFSQRQKLLGDMPVVLSIPHLGIIRTLQAI